MTAAGQDGRAARAARPLAVLAVLLGLLAMHGLASGHSGPASASAHGAGGGQSAHQSDPGSYAAPSLSLQQPAVPAAAPTCDDCSAGLVTLCVAVVVTGLALALAAVRRRRVPRVVAVRSVSSVRAPASARPTRPPPDLVRELCISRT